MTLLAIILLLTILTGLWRVVRGPTRADRLLAIQLFGTTGAALLMVVADWQVQPALLDAALVLALLATVVTVALVQLLRPAKDQS